MWTCSHCTFVNPNDTFLACEACGCEREFDNPLESAPPPLTKPGRPAPPRPPPTPKKTSSTPPTTTATTTSPALQRQQGIDKLIPILNELVESERSYVNELQAVVSVFLLPLKSRAQESDSFLLLESECDAVFGNIYEILRLNLDLLAAFDKTLVETKTNTELRLERLCAVFQSFVPHLKMYAFYAIKYDTATQQLKRFEEEKYRFAEFIQAASAMNSVTNGAPLNSFLIKPIQRVCKYPLFFSQVLKTLDGLENCSHLVKAAKGAFEAAGGVAQRINHDKMRAELNLRGFEVAKRLEYLSNVILEPGRKYLGEWKCLMSVGDSNLAKKRRSSSLAVKNLIVGEKKSRTCFLFSDCLIVSKEIYSKPFPKYELKLWMSMNQLQLCGINVNDPRTTPEKSSMDHPSPSPSPVPLSSFVDGFTHPSLSKQFKLPLDLFHLADSDRKVTETLRERQKQKAKEASNAVKQGAKDAASAVARMPSSFLSNLIHKSNNNSAAEEGGGPVITSHTLWFRSGAERERVNALLDKTHGEFNMAKAPPTSPLQRVLPSRTESFKDSTRTTTIVLAPVPMVRVQPPDAIQPVALLPLPPPIPPRVPPTPKTETSETTLKKPSRPRPPPPPQPAFVVLPPPPPDLTSKWFD